MRTVSKHEHVSQSLWYHAMTLSSSSGIKNKGDILESDYIIKRAEFEHSRSCGLHTPGCDLTKCARLRCAVNTNSQKIGLQPETK
jgi:hypothetical protein